MATVPVTLPDDVFSALRRSPSEVAADIRMTAVAHWYARGMLSQERAAQMVGLDRTDFLLALGREGFDVFKVDFKSLRDELADG